MIIPQNEKKIIVAIDGYAGAGKSTTAKEVARLLGYKYLNSGTLYRVICFYLIKKNIPITDNYKIKSELKNINIEFKYDSISSEYHITLNDQNIVDSHQLYNISIESSVALISSNIDVRKKVNKIQQNLGINGGIVIDGRDIGTKVFPNAELKIFMIADIDVRVSRRMSHMANLNSIAQFKDLKEKMLERDKRDINRKISPLSKAVDAIEIDTTHLNFQQIVKKIFSLAQEKLKNHV